MHHALHYEEGHDDGHGEVLESYPVVARRPKPGHEELVSLTRSASQVGTATHRLIALSALLSRDPSYELINKLGERHVGRQITGTARQALLMASITLTSVYFRRFRLPDATLEAVEEPVMGRQLDLVWRTPDRQLVADEIKTGRSSAQAALPQAQAQAMAGRCALGTVFTGVRIVCLRSAQPPVMVPAPEVWPA